MLKRRGGKREARGARRSTDFDLHFPDLVPDGAEAGVLSKPLKVRVFGEPSEITVAEREGFFEGRSGEVNLPVQGVAASEVVEDQRVARFNPGELFVHVEAVNVAAALGIVVAEELQGFDVFGLAVQQSFKKANFDIQIADLLAGEFLTASTAFSRHTTAEILKNLQREVKRKGMGDKR